MTTNHGQRFFLATALLELGAGLGLVGFPSLVMRLLLDVREPSPEALVVARVGGAALLAIGVASWLAREDRGSRSRHPLLWGILIYNAGACAVLAFAGWTLRARVVALLSVALIHAFMAIWCVAQLRAPSSDAP